MNVRASLFSVVVLFNGNRLLLLKRHPAKKFAPNQWTGLGGRVEPHELDYLEMAARREVLEETDLTTAELSDFSLRRTLTFFSRSEGLVTLLYFTGSLTSDRVPACTEGSLAWIDRLDLSSIDLIPNTGSVLPFVIDDFFRLRTGVINGVARLDVEDRVVGVYFPRDSVDTDGHD